MRARSVQRGALRDQLAAVLRDSDVPLTAAEAGAHVAYTGSMLQVNDPGRIACDDPRSRSQRDAWHECADGVCFWTIGGGIGTETARTQLQLLEAAGIVARFKMDRRVYWRWVGEPVDLPPLVVIEQR